MLSSAWNILKNLNFIRKFDKQLSSSTKVFILQWSACWSINQFVMPWLFASANCHFWMVQWIKVKEETQVR